MRPFLRSDGREYFLVRQQLSSTILLPGAKPFSCLIWDLGGERRLDDYRKVASALVDAGCFYLVCGGAECSKWEDAADDVIVERSLGSGVLPEVVTTSHVGESEEDVGFFFVACASSALAFSTRVVLVVGNGDGSTEAKLCAAIVDAERDRLHEASET